MQKSMHHSPPIADKGPMGISSPLYSTYSTFLTSRHTRQVLTDSSLNASSDSQASGSNCSQGLRLYMTNWSKDSDVSDGHSSFVGVPMMLRIEAGRK